VLAPAAAFTSMLIPNLPFADLSDIQNNFEQVGLATGFTIQQFIAQCVAFTVLFTVAHQFGWKKVRVILEQRRHTIEESMANAEKIKKELADAEASRLAVIHKANEQATQIIADAQKTAAVLAERKAQEATAQAEDIIRKAHEASVLDRNRLLAELKREVGALVVQTTEKVAGKVLNADDQNRLNSETLRQLGASNN
jgi:F-type H+-transporting ATPase subunit b